MDKRNRPALKRYRNGNNKTKFIPVSLKLSRTLIKEIEKRVKKEPDKNMSKFIEDTILSFTGNIEIKNGGRCKYRTYPIIKTFSFSEQFLKELKQQQNMSFYVEAALQKAFSV